MQRKHPSPKVKPAMSMVDVEERLPKWVTYLEECRVQELGLNNRFEARTIIAREAGTTAGHLENVLRDRLKRLTYRTVAGIRALMIRQLEREIAKLNHELQMVLQSGAGPTDLDFQEITATLATLKRRIKEAASN